MQDCPFCAEEIASGSEKCPAGGEWLGDEREETATRRPTTLLIVIGVFAALVLFVCVLGFVVPIFLFRVAPVPMAPVAGGSAALPMSPLPRTAVVDPTAPTTAPLNANGELDVAPARGGAEARYSIHSQGGFVLFDVGNLRIALRGTDTGGASGGGKLCVAPDGSRRSSGSHGFGSIVFQRNVAGTQTTCTFHELTFTFTGGKLSLGSHTLDVMGPKQVLVVDPDGANPVLKPYAGP